MAGMSRAEVGDIESLRRLELDRYRVAYWQHGGEVPGSVCLWGRRTKTAYLRDGTGDRRLLAGASAPSRSRREWVGVA